MKQVHVRVEDELYEKLNSYSAATDQTIQDCVREAVACYVTDMRKNSGKSLISSSHLLTCLRALVE